MTTSEPNEPSVVRRVAQLLYAFRQQDASPLGVSELSRRTGLPKSTVHRLVQELTVTGILERDGSAVRLGIRLFELGQMVNRQRELRSAAAPFMADLRASTSQTVNLAVLEGHEVVYLDILPVQGGPQLPSRVGGRMLAHATGIGKVILAHSDPQVVMAYLAAMPRLPRVSQRTITSPGVLLRELEQIRSTGIGFDREESGNGIVCAASAVVGPDGVVGGLSLTGWSTRINLSRLGPAVHTAALNLSRHLSGGLPRRPLPPLRA